MSALSPETDNVPVADFQAFWRRRMEADPWLFSKYVCGHGARAVERVHRPLLYLYTRQAELLLACLLDERFDGYLTDQIRRDFRTQKISLNPTHLPQIRRRLRRVNIRLPRGIGKSTFADDADLWEGVVDPNITISLGSKADPYAEQRITAMGEVVKSAQFGFWFPDRVPTNLKEHVTSNYILLAGRTTVGEVEGTIEGRGITSQWSGYHYRKNRRDDIVGTESGEASLEDAIRHLADMSSLRHKFDWRGDVYIGVVTGENDDHSLLIEDENVLSVTMPMEEHNGGTTIENVYSDGILTMPEWEGFSREGVNLIKDEAKRNPEHGPIYLLQNFYMTAHKTGTSLFTRRMLDRCLYRTLTDANGKSIILRPKKGRVAKCYAQWKDQGGERKNFNLDDWFVLDPATLPVSAFGLAADQSVTQDRSGDEWALGAVCLDWEGTFYLLDVIKGRGYQNMLDELLPFDKKYRSGAKFGLDANATQGMTVEWIKRTEEFRSIARRVEPVRSGGDAKDVNIRNYVQARMLSEGLYINPDLPDYHAELLKYRPRTADGKKKRGAVDNQLDVTWMAMTLPTPPLSPETEEEIEMESFLSAERHRRSTDPQTHIMNESWMDAVDW